METITGPQRSQLELTGHAYRVPRPQQRFYVRMAALFILTAMVGFVPTYWTPIARGTIAVSPIVHLHAALFFGWTVLFFVQTRLAAAGQLARHRALGVFGVALATGMLFVGIATSIQSMKHTDATSFAAAGRAFAIVSVSGILIFAVLVAVALMNVRNPEIHKRLMLVATASILQAPIGRLFLLAFRPVGPLGPPPVARTPSAGIVTDLFIVAAMVYDRRTRGRVHPAYWLGGASVLTVQLLRAPVSETRVWLRISDWLVALLR